MGVLRVMYVFKKINRMNFRVFGKNVMLYVVSLDID